MAFNFYMPDIGEGVVEGEIVAWKVKVGDKVRLDQPLVEVMTDKATVELPSPRAGTITQIHYKDGQICPVGQILVVIEEDAAAAGAKPEARPADNGHGHGHGHAGHAPTAAPAPSPAHPPGPPMAPSSPSPAGAIHVVDATAT